MTSRQIKLTKQYLAGKYDLLGYNNQAIWDTPTKLQKIVLNMPVASTNWQIGAQ